MRVISMLLLVAAIVCLSADAHATVLTGTVVNPEGDPLPSVSIVTNERGVGTLTQADGTFELTLTPEVTHVTFSSVGYYSRQFKADRVPKRIVLEHRYYEGGEILVTAGRAEAGVTPVAFDNFSRDEIERDYTVGEFPVLLETTPNMLAFTDGGTLGYSYTNIRGFDDKRITTYINGVPLNDPEDQATYFADLPDFAANVDDIQVQRGVGNSLYGDASFGGSINVVTSALSRDKSVKLTSGTGIYERTGTRSSYFHKQSVEYSSGLIDGRWHFTGRFSKQSSDGYRDNAWYDGWSYYFSLARLDPTMTSELYVYGGPMRLHLAYWGSSKEAIAANRLDNPLTYRNETDNFNQPHYHFHNTIRLSDRAMLDNTLYYIHGHGYYEQYKSGQTLADYNIGPSVVALDTAGNPYTQGDLVRQQWVTKNQLGWNPRLEIDHAKGRHVLGGSVYYFESDHHGQVVWAQHIAGLLDPRHKYYQYFGEKWQSSFYAQERYEPTDKLSTQLTAQVRYQRYQFDQVKLGAFKGYDYTVDWLFFSPRVGLTYAATDALSLFGNFAVSSRTPTDASIYDANNPDILPSLEIKYVNADETVYRFGDPTIENERVLDFELGATYRKPGVTAEVNLFWMDFKNEIIPYDGVDDDGQAYIVNADRSVHAGIELASSVRPTECLTLSGNLSYNYNRVKEYKAQIDGYPIDFAGRTISGAPDVLANLIADVTHADLRVTGRLRVVGKRYMELLNFEEYAIDPYATVSMSAAYTIKSVLGLGNVTVSTRVDNLFNKEYLAAGYGGNFAYEDEETDGVITGGWAEYFVAPERTWYTQVSMELF